MVKRREAAPTIIVKKKMIAFWDDITKDQSEVALRFLNEGEKVTLLEEKFYYRVPWSDKPYYKVKHNIYGEGYVLAEAF